MTGDEDLEVAEQAKRNGANFICILDFQHFLVKKPVTSDDLGKLIAQWPGSTVNSNERIPAIRVESSKENNAVANE